MTAAEKRKLSATEYLALERGADYRSQFWEGEIFAMAGNSPEHSEIATNLTGELFARLKGGGGKCRVYGSDMRVRISADKYVYPDLSIVCGEPRFDNDTLLNPVAIIEILSPSTESFDRGKKFAGYREIPTLRDYVLVAQDAPVIERFSLTDGKWTLTDTRGLDATLDLPAAAIRVPLRDVFARVSFTGAG
ncbi:MAG: Uma2 family endonuclease [Planctomycetota bacterium]